MKKLSETLLFLFIADCCLHLDTLMCNNFFEKIKILDTCYLPYTSAVIVFYAIMIFALSFRVKFSYDKIDLERIMMYFDKYQLHNNQIFYGKQSCGSLIDNCTINAHISLYLKIKLLRFINTDLFNPKFFLICSMLSIPLAYSIYVDVLLPVLPKLAFDNTWPIHILCLSLIFIIYHKCATNFFTLKISGICCVLYILLTQNVFDFCFFVVFGYICVKIEDRLLKIDAISRILCRLHLLD